MPQMPHSVWAETHHMHRIHIPHRYDAYVTSHTETCYIHREHTDIVQIITVLTQTCAPHLPDRMHPTDIAHGWNTNT